MVRVVRTSDREEMGQTALEFLTRTEGDLACAAIAGYLYYAEQMGEDLSEVMMRIEAWLENCRRFNAKRKS